VNSHANLTTRLWEYVSPALVFLLMLTSSALLIHQVNCLSTIGHLWFQGGCMVLATFVAVLLVLSCAHADKSSNGRFSVGVILGMTFAMW
jgi:hypothetical protein